MTRHQRQLHLNVNVLASGRHDAAWRTGSNPDPVADIDHFIEVARIAERGKFDAIFFADGPQLNEEYTQRPWHSLDPIVLLPALAIATTHVGLVGTASTTFNEPYHVARRFATLDHVSKGRAAWNIVTSQSDAAAANFGTGALPDHAARYARAHEFVDVVTRLWDSFDDDAIVADQASGRYADPAKVHRADYHGSAFDIAGPLNVPRAPQGHPVIVQAGDSPASRDLGSRWADALFTVQRTLPEAKAFYTELKGRASAHGRNPDHLLILPGLHAVVGSTEQEAWARKNAMDGLLDLDAELVRLAHRIGIDPGWLHLDRPFPDDLETAAGGDVINSGFAQNLLREARREGLTVRQVLARNPIGGHRLLVGTPEQVADNLEEWFRAGAADGFNLNMDALPDGLSRFVDHVVPELQRRGLFRHEYDGTTLRSHLGLPRPQSRYAHGLDPAAEPSELTPAVGA